MKALRNLKLIAAGLALIMLGGTAGFHFIEGWSWFDGFYMTLITLTTIGYGETHPLSHAGKVFNSALIVVGVGTVFLAIGSLTQALLEFELQSVFGRKRMEREISRLTGHYIICGAGRVGRSVAREFARRSVPFVIRREPPRPYRAHRHRRLAHPAGGRYPGTYPRRSAHLRRPVGSSPPPPPMPPISTSC